jgi:hypothetical protein
MATTYTSTVQVRCWKRHQCVGCGGGYQYELVRTVKGTGGTADAARANAQKIVQKTLATDTDLQPCPTCGLHQPDMIAQRRSKRHWIMFWLVLLAALVLVILVATHTVQLYVSTWIAAVLCAGAALASLLAERWNPNRDLADNRRRAADLTTRGIIKHEPGQPVPEAALEPHARPGATPLHIAALALAALAILTAIVPEVARLAQGWPANAEAWPPVVGPGDEARIYMNQSISSIKGYWRGSPEATIKAGDKSLQAKAKTNDNSWGGTIMAKSSEKSNSSTPWVAVTLPNAKTLANKTVGCDIDLSVTYPESYGGSSFRTTSSKMHRSLKLDLADAGAGDTYAVMWWAGTLGAIFVALLSGVLLVVAARALRSKAHPTQVFWPNP